MGLVGYDAELFDGVDVRRELLLLHQLLLDEGCRLPDARMLFQLAIVELLSLAIAGLRWMSDDVDWLWLLLLVLVVS